MNKILHINIGGLPFTIDEDAFQYFDNYLNNLNKHFAGSDGSKEIMQDIEQRIAEILQEKLQKSAIINKQMIEQIIATMGTPKDFESTGSTSTTEEKDWGFHPGKKLFRDPNNKKIAGVCSGLSHYLGIEDPIFLRIAFILGLSAGGFTFILYMILWIVTKPATTASDFLQMKGMPINIDNIAAKVEEKFVRLTNKIEDLIEKTSKTKNY